MMETHSHTTIDKDYIDHAIKFMERRTLPDDDPILDRLNLEIMQVKFARGFLFCRFLLLNNCRMFVLLQRLVFAVMKSTDILSIFSFFSSVTITFQQAMRHFVFCLTTSKKMQLHCIWNCTIG